MTTRAVILARGLGTRMRRPDAGARLDAAQAAIADSGVKALIPVGRPFLDYVLSALADSGITAVCLVVGPEHTALRAHYTGMPMHRLRVHFAVQQEPLGTADAVLAARAFTGGDPFLVLNSDNYYPPDALRALATACEPAVIGFGRAALLADGLIAAERIAAYALVERTSDGYLRRIVEKPDAATLAAAGDDAFVSMNCWRFGPEIFRACEEVHLSARGERELPLAVQHAIAAHGVRVRVIPAHATVLDLSTRGDVATVASRLRGVRVSL